LDYQNGENEIALRHMVVRSILECGGSTPPWHNAEEEDQGGARPPLRRDANQEDQGGVEPPHSKVLRTQASTMANRKLMHSRR
jgi:hypothetical protein